MLTNDTVLSLYLTGESTTFVFMKLCFLVPALLGYMMVRMTRATDVGTRDVIFRTMMFHNQLC